MWMASRILRGTICGLGPENQQGGAVLFGEVSKGNDNSSVFLKKKKTLLPGGEVSNLSRRGGTV